MQTHAAEPHDEDEEKFKQLFQEADARIVAELEKKAGAGIGDGTYSYGGKKITVTCVGCEEPIAKAEATRALLESLASDMNGSFMKDGLTRLIEMVKRDEAQARARSFMHHHFPKLLDEYDALVR